MIEWRLWTDNVIIHLGRIVADAATCTFLHEGRTADIRRARCQGRLCGAFDRHIIAVLQDCYATSFFCFANELRPNQSCMVSATCRSPISSILFFSLLRVPSPIQIAVMVRRSVVTYRLISNLGSDQHRSTSPSGSMTSHQVFFVEGKSEYIN